MTLEFILGALVGGGLLTGVGVVCYNLGKASNGKQRKPRKIRYSMNPDFNSDPVRARRVSEDGEEDKF